MGVGWAQGGRRVGIGLEVGVCVGWPLPPPWPLARFWQPHLAHHFVLGKLWRKQPERARGQESVCRALRLMIITLKHDNA